MEYHLKNDGDFELEFDGELLASVSSHSPTSRRWTELNLYKTATGKYVVQSIGRSNVSGEVDMFACHVYDNTYELMQNTGRGKLAVDLYKQGGITATKRI